MNEWKVEILKIIRLALGNPEHQGELVVLLVLAAITLVMVFNIASKALRLPMPETGRCTASLVIGCLVLVLIVAAVDIYLVPRLRTATLQRLIPVITAAAVLLAAVVPVSCFFLKSKYFPTLLSLLLSIIAGAAVVLLVGAGFRAVRQGSRELGKAKNKKEEIEELLSK